MLKSVLTPPQEALLQQERQWLLDLQVIMARLGATNEDQQTLKRSIQQLDELFLLVIVGEFNAGKSAFINALLGQQLLKEGVTPTTAEINRLKYSETSQHHVEEANLHVFGEPIELLQHINIVDTPGTNAVIREHQEITEEFVPRSDLVLFITSADRPFTESERQFLDQIKAWGKKVVLVINKVDIFESEKEMAQVIEFVRHNGAVLLGVTPDVFPVSAKQALKAKQGHPQLWTASRFEPLEQYINNTLDQTSRLRLKFLNPLGIGDRLLTKYSDITDNRLSLLAEDTETLANLERQLTLYQQDMRRDFEFRLADIENILYDMEKRGNDFFDETMRVARIFDLMNKEQIQQEFEVDVVADLPEAVEKRVTEMVDWLVNADLKQWHGVMEYLDQRRQEYKKHIVGEVGGNFKYDRDRLIDSVGKTAQEVVDTYNISAEADKIASGAQKAVAETAAAEVGAIGIGAVITALATTAAVDVTGILAAGMVAALGLFVIPARRQSAKKDMSGRLASLREQLTEALTVQFEREIKGSIERINEAVAPYTRFVRAEQEKLQATREALSGAHQTHGRLRSEIETLL